MLEAKGGTTEETAASADATSADAAGETTTETEAKVDQPEFDHDKFNKLGLGLESKGAEDAVDQGSEGEVEGTEGDGDGKKDGDGQANTGDGGSEGEQGGGGKEDGVRKQEDGSEGSEGGSEGDGTGDAEELDDDLVQRCIDVGMNEDLAAKLYKNGVLAETLDEFEKREDTNAGSDDKNKPGSEESPEERTPLALDDVKLPDFDGEEFEDLPQPLKETIVKQHEAVKSDMREGTAILSAVVEAFNDVRREIFFMSLDADSKEHVGVGLTEQLKAADSNGAVATRNSIEAALTERLELNQNRKPEKRQTYYQMLKASTEAVLGKKLKKGSDKKTLRKALERAGQTTTKDKGGRKADTPQVVQQKEFTSSGKKIGLW